MSEISDSTHLHKSGNAEQAHDATDLSQRNVLSDNEILQQIDLLESRTEIIQDDWEKLSTNLDNISETEQFGLYKNIFLRIENELPTFLLPLQEIGIKDDIISYNLEGNIHGVNVVWDVPEIRAKGGGGQYFVSSRKIEMAEKKPTMSEVIYDFGTYGDLHPKLKMVTHEFTHDMQYYLPDEKGKTTVPYKAIQQDLKEAQAKLISNPNLSIEELVTETTDAKKNDGSLMYPGIKSARFLSGVKSFTALSFAGVSQVEIAKLVRDPGEWNDDTMRYTTIYETAIKTLQQVDKNPLYLEEREELNRIFSILKIMNIAYEEVKQIT